MLVLCRGGKQTILKGDEGNLTVFFGSFLPIQCNVMHRCRNLVEFFCKLKSFHFISTSMNNLLQTGFQMNSSHSLERRGHYWKSSNDHSLLNVKVVV